MKPGNVPNVVMGAIAIVGTISMAAANSIEYSMYCCVGGLVGVLLYSMLKLIVTFPAR